MHELEHCTTDYQGQPLSMNGAWNCVAPINRSLTQIMTLYKTAHLKALHRRAYSILHWCTQGTKRGEGYIPYQFSMYIGYCMGVSSPWWMWWCPSSQAVLVHLALQFAHVSPAQHEHVCQCYRGSLQCVNLMWNNRELLHIRCSKNQKNRAFQLCTCTCVSCMALQSSSCQRLMQLQWHVSLIYLLLCHVHEHQTHCPLNTQHTGLCTVQYVYVYWGLLEEYIAFWLKDPPL